MIVNVLNVRRILPNLTPVAAVGSALPHGRRWKMDGHIACAHTSSTSMTTIYAKRAIRLSLVVQNASMQKN